MNLADGLAYYKQCSDSDWDFTLKVESAEANVMQSISLHRDRPSASALAAAHDLLMDIEKWKAMCLKDRMGNAELNRRSKCVPKPFAPNSARKETADLRQARRKN